MSIFRRKKDEKKERADFSNVQPGSTSTAVETEAPTSETPEAPPATGGSSAGQTHVVAEGESLSRIAKRHYGDGNQWRRIYDANRDQLSDPDRIHPGQTLKIPPA